MFSRQPRKRPVRYPHLVTIRLDDRVLDKLNHCADLEGAPRALMLRRWITERLDQNCPDPPCA